ncbi:MAG: hypothetical protein AB1646_10610 [Thermodesulfobacteriota bacterium]
MDPSEMFKSLQTHWNNVVALELGYTLVNFLCSCTMAYLSFRLFFIYQLGKNSTILKLMRRIEVIRKYSPERRKGLRRFEFLRAVFTGSVATALIAVQAGRLNLVSAIAYGLVGPFALTSMLVGRMRDDSLEGTPGALSGMADEFDGIKREVSMEVPGKDDPFGSEVAKIEEELGKK